MKKKKMPGFSLIEVLVGLFLVAVAVLGLAQLFLLSVANNRNADRISTATNLAKQQIEWLRSLTSEELELIAGSDLAAWDETLDINLDSTNDYRRVTDVSVVDFVFEARIFVYSAEKFAVDLNELIPNPQAPFDTSGRHRPRAFMSTIITR
jgi:prepilin-type N-terminal cleavage/methylation domain-containing protein